MRKKNMPTLVLGFFFFRFLNDATLHSQRKTNHLAANEILDFRDEPVAGARGAGSGVAAGADLRPASVEKSVN